MKKILLIFLLATYSVFSFAQDTNKVIIQDQAIKYTNFQWLSDSVRFTGIGGIGTILKIDENGWLYVGSGTQDTLIDTSQVVNLNRYLNLKQNVISVDSNFVFQGDTFVRLNDTIWLNVGVFRDEVRILNNAPRIYMSDLNSTSDNKNTQMTLESGELRFQYLNDLGIGGGDYMTLLRSGNNMTSLSIYDNAVSRIDLKNSGTGVFEDTVRSGQLKVAGILYPLSDGTSGQVLQTNGSGVLSFSDVGGLLTAGTGITISNDTISATGGSGDSDWTVNGNYVYNLSDSIGIGVSDPEVALEIDGRTIMTNLNTTLTVTNTGASAALNLVSNVAGNAITINSYDIDSVSNDNTLSGNDANDLVTEQAVKGYVDERILNDTRVSWAADVDTSARVDGFVLKWNNGTKTHYYDTAGTGGGGSTYFAGAGLELAANVFSIGDDSVKTSMIQDDAITYSKLQNVGGNSVLARASSGSGDVSEVALASSRLLGRGSTGNVAAISIGSGLVMSGTTLSATNTGTVTNIAAGNGMNFSSITTTGTVTMGTPSTLTGSSTNAVTTTSHTHALDFTTFQSNVYAYYLDTNLVEVEFKDATGVPITTDEKVIAFTRTSTVDSVLLDEGYYIVRAKATIKIANSDTISNFFQNYTLQVRVCEIEQQLGRELTGVTVAKPTSVSIETAPQKIDGDGNTVDGDFYMTIISSPIKINLNAGEFFATTIKATYGGVADHVQTNMATMVVERVLPYESSKEQNRP